MGDKPTVELGTFQMRPGEVPSYGSLFERGGTVYEVTLIKDAGGFIEGGLREFVIYGVQQD